MQVNPLLHGSHPLTSMHSLLYHVPDDDQLRLVVSDLDFITMSGRYLSLLASKVTQLQSLLRYIKQVQTQIQLEWKNTQELPGRYMRSANMDLEEKLGCDFTTAAYHLLITGDCWEPLREFLVDIVGDRVSSYACFSCDVCKTDLIRAINAGIKPSAQAMMQYEHSPKNVCSQL